MAAILGCSSDGSGPGDDQEPAEPADATVTVADFSFSPSTTNITTGQTVRWTWSTGPHNVTFADQTTSGNRSSGSFDRTFSAAGTFAYQCTLHAGMNGSVVVAAAGTGGGGTGGGGTGGGGTGGGGGGGYDG